MIARHTPWIQIVADVGTCTDITSRSYAICSLGDQMEFPFIEDKTSDVGEQIMRDDTFQMTEKHF